MCAFRPSQPPVPPGLPPGYLQKGYFDAKGNLLPEVILDWSKEIARNLVAGRMTTSQLRGFFKEARSLETRLEAAEDFDIVRPGVLKLSVFAAQAFNKGKVPILFQQFIDTNVKLAARGEKEFMAFVSHFECVVGFFPVNIR